MKHLYDKKRFIYHKQTRTSIEHILQNVLNIEYFTCDKLKDISVVVHIYNIKLEN